MYEQSLHSVTFAYKPSDVTYNA